MGISLKKDESFEIQADLAQVMMGLGWDPAKSGLLSSFFGGGGNVDLDASCVVFDNDNRMVDTISFQKLRGVSGAIVHAGDNLTGEGEGDDEKIFVDLTKLPASVKSLVFTINSFRGQTFDAISGGYCRLVNSITKEELCSFQISGGGNHTAMIMAKVVRIDNKWIVTAIGAPCNGRVVGDLVNCITPLL